MTIGIDARVLQEGGGGVFVYAKNLLEYLIPLSGKHSVKLFLNKYKKKDSKLINDFLKYDHVRRYQYRFPNKFLNASFKFSSWPRIDELMDGCDVLFYPSMLYCAHSENTKSVLTMHDLSYEFFPDCFTLKQRLWHKLMNPERLCARSDKIIAVSESTKQDIARCYGIESKKIKVAHSGVDRRFRLVAEKSVLNYVKNKYHLPEGNYIIQTGTFEPRKNHLATLEAFTKWALENATESRGWRLLFVGNKGWKSKNAFDAIRKSMVRDRVHVIANAPEDDLPALYSLSKICVYPSFYEGFGFPPLEAFSCSVPVIASANSSIGEIVSDAGILVNPYKVDEIISAIRDLANDSSLAKQNRAKGLARTTEFSWESAARKTLRVLEEV